MGLPGGYQKGKSQSQPGRFMVLQVVGIPGVSEKEHPRGAQQAMFYFVLFLSQGLTMET